MSELYAGNPASYPANYTIPDDSDPPTATAVNVGLEALGDRTAYLKAHYATPVYAEFLADGSITFPADALPFAIVEACGGGGGGGGGAGNTAGTGSLYASGGGGGGGARQSTQLVTIVPGEQYDFAIGAGGIGGLQGDNTTAALPGGDGGDTTLTRHSTSTVVATWRGAAGGFAGKLNDLTDGLWVKSTGGSPCRETMSFTTLSCDASTITILQEIGDCIGTPQHGSAGCSSNFAAHIRSRQGSSSPQGFAGGSAGVADVTSSGTFHGGGGGGGGGAGPYGPGGAGGDGGTPNNAGGSSGGTAGVSGGANTGAGAGGGGASGGASGSGIGGLGHTGGSGRARVLYFVKAL